MDTTSHPRFRSGEICISAGWYEFDGYAEGPPYPMPPLHEMERSLGAGDVFPEIRNPQRACFWRLADGLPYGDLPHRESLARMPEAASARLAHLTPFSEIRQPRMPRRHAPQELVLLR